MEEVPLTGYVYGRTISIIGIILSLVALGAKAKDSVSLSLQDKKNIAAAVIHSIHPLLSRTRSLEVTVALTINGDDSGELVRYVISTYPKTQRFIRSASHIEREGCFYDKESRLPSLGIGLGEIKAIDSTIVEVDAGSALCIMGSIGATYRLQKTGGKWKIIEIHENYII